MRFEILSSGVQWYFRIVSGGNYRVLATSERYHNKSDARATAQLIINSAGSGYIVE